MIYVCNLVQKKASKRYIHGVVKFFHSHVYINKDIRNYLSLHLIELRLPPPL